MKEGKNWKVDYCIHEMQVDTCAYCQDLLTPEEEEMKEKADLLKRVANW